MTDNDQRTVVKAAESALLGIVEKEVFFQEGLLGLIPPNMSCRFR